jgi:hypothetical protein
VDDSLTSLTFVGSVIEGDDGRFYVTQPQDAEIRIYDEAGELAGRFGREGEGPGEFRGLQGIGWWAGGRDTLWAFDQQLRRVSLFDRDGTFARSIAMSPAAFREVFRPSVQTILPDGSALGSPSYASALLADGRIHSIPILRFPIAGGEPSVVVETEAGNRQVAIAVGTGQSYSAQPYSDAPFAVLSGEAQRVAVIERPTAAQEGDARYRVTMLGASGDTLWSREYTYAPSPVPAAERDSVRAARLERAVDFATRAGGTRADAEKQIDEKLHLPAFRPPIAEGRLTNDGSLWLRLTAAPGGATRWARLDPDGEPDATLDLPTGLRLVEIQGSRGWAVQTDELGVPYVVSLKVGPADPS